MIIDTHCHLTLTKHIALATHLRNAGEAGIKIILDPGLCMADLETRYQQLKPYLHNPLEKSLSDPPKVAAKVVLGLAVAPHYLSKPDRSDVNAGSSSSYSAPAIPPSGSADIDDIRNQLTKILKNKNIPVVALSEIGLDYYHMVRSKKEQRELLAMQLNLAAEFDLPVFLHIRDAYPDAYEIVKASGHKRGAVHCFSGRKSDAENFLACGFHLSFSGIVTFKKSTEQREVVKTMPVGRILSETDAPYLAPEPFRGKWNESQYIVHTNTCIAEQIEKSVEDTNNLLAENAEKLLGI